MASRSAPQIVRGAHGAVVARAPGATRFLAYLAKQAQRFEPPLGFFRDFVLEDSGAHRNTLDLDRP